MSESRNHPVAAFVTWAAQGSPAVPSAHRYRATVNLPGGGTRADVEIGRPGHELWDSDQLVHPLEIGDRINGEVVGQHLFWQFTERPVIGECDDVPGGPGGGVVIGVTPAGVFPSIGDGTIQPPPRPTSGMSIATRMLLSITGAELDALSAAIDARRASR